MFTVEGRTEPEEHDRLASLALVCARIPISVQIGAIMCRFVLTFVSSVHAVCIFCCLLHLSFEGHSAKSSPKDVVMMEP